jgi:serine/threonine-protein kinase HipA
MDKEVLVYVDLQGTPHLVGRLWARMRKDRESATFEYDKNWLTHSERFSLELALKLGPGPFHTPSDKPLFGAIGDSVPDRWGRVLMRRAERRRAEREGQAPCTVREIDYLLMVDDEARQGALRFAEREGGPFLAEHGPTKIPPLIELPRLLSAAEHVLSDTDSDEDLRLLLAPGSSLGGARPKASVRDRDGHLAIAKFPNKGDEVNTVLWEAVALTLAAKAGIPVPAWRLSPAYDLNPVPTDIKPRVLTTAIDLDDGTASLQLALRVASYFELAENEAHMIAGQVGQAVAAWRREAKKLGLTRAEIDRMSSAFEHEDLKAAVAAVSPTKATRK